MVKHQKVGNLYASVDEIEVSASRSAHLVEKVCKGCQKVLFCFVARLMLAVVFQQALSKGEAKVEDLRKWGKRYRT